MSVFAAKIPHMSYGRCLPIHQVQIFIFPSVQNLPLSLSLLYLSRPISFCIQFFLFWAIDSYMTGYVQCKINPYTLGPYTFGYTFFSDKVFIWGALIHGQWDFHYIQDNLGWISFIQKHWYRAEGGRLKTSPDFRGSEWMNENVYLS